MKIRPEGADLFPADGRKDGRTDGHDAFRSFEKAPKKIQSPNVLLIYMNEAHDDKGHSTLHPADKSRFAGYKRFGTSTTSQCDFCQALAQAFRPVKTEAIR